MEEKINKYKKYEIRNCYLEKTVRKREKNKEPELNRYCLQDKTII